MNNSTPVKPGFDRTCDGKARREFCNCEPCNIARAREVYAVTRPMNLPRAPLYVPGEKAPKGKNIPNGPIAKRVVELKKKYPTLSTFDAQRVQLNALLAARYEKVAA